MKRCALFAAVFCLGLFHHHRHCKGCDAVVAAPFVSSYAVAAPVYASPAFVASPVFVATPSVAVVNAHGVSVAVNAGSNVRVRRGVFGGTVVRVR